MTSWRWEMHPSPHPHPSPSPRPWSLLFFFFFYHRRCWLPSSWREFFAWLLAASGKKLVATERPPSLYALLAPLVEPWAGTSSEQPSILVGNCDSRESNDSYHYCSYYYDDDEQRHSAGSYVLVHVLVMGCGCVLGVGSGRGYASGCGSVCGCGCETDRPPAG